MSDLMIDQTRLMSAYMQPRTPPYSPSEYKNIMSVFTDLVGTTQRNLEPLKELLPKGPFEDIYDAMKAREKNTGSAAGSPSGASSSSGGDPIAAFLSLVDNVKPDDISDTDISELHEHLDKQRANAGVMLGFNLMQNAYKGAPIDPNLAQAYASYKSIADSLPVIREQMRNGSAAVKKMATRKMALMFLDKDYPELSAGAMQAYAQLTGTRIMAASNERGIGAQIAGQKEIESWRIIAGEQRQSITFKDYLDTVELLPKNRRPKTTEELYEDYKKLISKSGSQLNPQENAKHGAIENYRP